MSMEIASAFKCNTEGENMKRNEIEKELVKQDSTILSFPNRGPWGESSYRGNCSGWIHAFLIWKYQVEKMAELFSGSGTGYDVCQDMNISYVGADLNPNPVRPGILNVNAITDEVPMEFMDADMLFMHPPYSNVCKIDWAGKAYPDKTGELKKSDLGNMPWEQFIQVLNTILMRYYTSMQNGGRMAVLMGDVRRNGKFYSMLSDIVKPGNLEQIIIKTQHNTFSGRQNIAYTHRNFVPIAHEYIMVLKKLAPYIIDFHLPKKYEVDVRDSQCATWRDVVAAVLQNLGNEASLQQIYAEIEGHKKCENNSHWREKVRQVLQEHSIFVNLERGVWTMAA